jgi:hypothetical protein
MKTPSLANNKLCIGSEKQKTRYRQMTVKLKQDKQDKIIKKYLRFSTNKGQSKQLTSRGAILCSELIKRGKPH